MRRILQHWVTFEECGGDINKAWEIGNPFDARILCVERREDIDVFAVWYVLEEVK